LLKKETSQPAQANGLKLATPVRRPSEQFFNTPLNTAPVNEAGGRHSFSATSPSGNSRQSFTETSYSYSVGFGDRESTLSGGVERETGGKKRRSSGFGALLFSSSKDKDSSPRHQGSISDVPARKGSFFSGKSKLNGDNSGKGLARTQSFGGSNVADDSAVDIVDSQRSTFAFGTKAPMSDVEADAMAAREVSAALLEAVSTGSSSKARTDPNSAPPLLSLLTGEDLLAATERALAAATSAKDFTLLVRTYFHQMEAIESFCLRYDEIIRSVVGGHDIPVPDNDPLTNVPNNISASKDEGEFDGDWERPVKAVGIHHLGAPGNLASGS
jgi:hypothetical protein